LYFQKFKNLSTLDEKYLGTGGRFVSEPFCLSENGATVTKLETLDTVPNQTEIEYKQSSDYTDKYAKEYLDKSDEDEEVYVGVHEE
jgi:hypothetical protein